MEISRKSWFLKLYQYWHTYWQEPTNLCDLVRGALFGLIKGAVQGLVVGLASLFMLTVLFAPIYAVFWDVSPDNAAVMVGTILWFIGGSMVVGYFLYDWYTDFRYRRTRYRSPSPPSVIGEYLRARKQKICPLITIKD